MSAQFRTDQSFCVRCASPSLEAAAIPFQKCHPDCVLLDADLIGVDANASFAALDVEFRRVPVLLLDKDTNLALLTAVLTSSSIGYFTRDASSVELIDGIRRLARGERVFCPYVARRVESTGAGWRFRSDQPHTPFDGLTRREMQIARLIAAGSTVPECASALHLSPSTVDNHKSRLMKKLGLHKALELTRMAIREGLIRN
ncbi:MAG TPA: response regulator transcription factor [Lacipirellulaceae bacterium]